MKHFELKGEIREVSNKAAIKAIRREGLVPCNLYGHGIDNILFTVEEKELKGITHTPNAYIIDLILGDKKYFAIVHELQYHPVKDNCLHVDFLNVTETEPITITVPIWFEGQSLGAKQGGKFRRSLRRLRINALMENLPDDIVVDITNLKIGHEITAGDIKIENVNVCTPKKVGICSVLASRNAVAAEEEEEETEE